MKEPDIHSVYQLYRPQLSYNHKQIGQIARQTYLQTQKHHSAARWAYMIYYFANQSITYQVYKFIHSNNNNHMNISIKRLYRENKYKLQLINIDR